MKISKRMTLELDEVGDRDLADARDLSGSATFAAAARLALLVFAALLRERRAGTRLILERRDGEALEAALPAPARDGLEWVGGGHQRFSDLAQALRTVAASPLVSHEVRFGINGELERLASNDGAPADLGRPW